MKLNGPNVPSNEANFYFCQLVKFSLLVTYKNLDTAAHPVLSNFLFLLEKVNSTQIELKDRRCE